MRPRVISPMVGGGEIFFSNFFLKWASCPKNSGGFTDRQNFTVLFSTSQGDEWPSTGIVVHL